DASRKTVENAAWQAGKCFQHGNGLFKRFPCVDYDGKPQFNCQLHLSAESIFLRTKGCFVPVQINTYLTDGPEDAFFRFSAELFKLCACTGIHMAGVESHHRQTIARVPRS